MFSRLALAGRKCFTLDLCSTLKEIHEIFPTQKIKSLFVSLFFFALKIAHEVLMLTNASNVVRAHGPYFGKFRKTIYYKNLKFHIFRNGMSEKFHINFLFDG